MNPAALHFNRACDRQGGWRKRSVAASALAFALLLGPAQAIDDGFGPAALVAPATPPAAPARTISAAGEAPDMHTTGAIPPAAVSATTEAPTPLQLPQEAVEALKLALSHYERGRITEGDAALAGVDYADVRLAAEWSAARSGAPAVGFSRIERFLNAAPAWLPVGLPQKRAEEAMLRQRIDAARVLAFFATRQPTTPAGRAALALALKQAGQHAQADAMARSLWRSDAMGKELEQTVLKAFEGVLGQRDHRDRMEMLLFRDSREAALRSAARAGPDHVKLAQARIAVERQAGDAAKALAAVPATLRGDSSFVFAQAQHHRRKGEADSAAKLIAPLPRDEGLLVDGDEWWVERRLIARQLLDKGLAEQAYTVAAGHAAETAQSIIEAEWHAGWIALRFLSDPMRALPHFEAAGRHAETPISTSRAAYWQGRALEAMGRDAEAVARFEAAAQRPIAYYGQLARARLGALALPMQGAEPNGAPPHPALTLIGALEASGQHGLARSLILDFARSLTDAAALAQMVDVAPRIGDTRLLVTIGKAAVQRGLPFDVIAYPISGIPPFEPAGLPVERAIVHAIARQESAFDPAAVSHAGARGLMQMMLPTARETARRIGVGFEPQRLTSDPSYNAQLGAAHLGDLLRDWRGSYLLAFAAYNAGSGNVRNWIEAYGDPRLPGVDPVDWIERIPFTETRNYVQRVMENLQVYRSRLGEHGMLLIASDLNRGRRLARFAGEASTEVPALAAAPPAQSTPERTQVVVDRRGEAP